MYYYRYEVKGIQSWLLSSSRLRDLSGGSTLIRELENQAKQMIEDAGGKLLYSAAGGATSSFPDLESLRSFAAEWPMTVAYRAPGLQMVQAWVDPDSVEDPKRELFERLAQARNVVLSPHIEPGPWMERAGRTGLPAVPRPAGIHQRPGDPTVWDAPAAAKALVRQEKPSESTLKELLGNVSTIADVRIDDDVESPLWGDGPVAVIHADGSGIGQRITGLKGFAELERFSAALTRCTTQATSQAFETLAKRSRAGGDAVKVAARLIVAGGDELTLILPAGEAMDFVWDWLTSFEQASSGEAALNGQLFAGAGIVLVNRSYPFSSAYELAEALCRAAKRESLDDDNNPSTSVLRFYRNTSSLVDEEDWKRFSTTWTLDQREALDELLSATAALPRGAFRNWLGLVARDETPTADKVWRRAAEVADPGKWKRFADALEKVGAVKRTGRFPDKEERESKGAMTPMVDILGLVQVKRRKSK